LRLEFARAGFELPARDTGLGAFKEELERCVSEVLRGPGRERIIRQARRLTGWPATILAEIPPLAFIGFSSFKIVQAYFSIGLLSGAFFVHSGAVIAILLVAELIILSLMARVMAWSTRTTTVRNLRTALSGTSVAFLPERTALDEAGELAKQIDELHGQVVRNLP